MRACKRPSQARVQVSDHDESESEEGLSSDFDPATEHACKRAACINTAQGNNDNTTAEVGSNPFSSTPLQQQHQQHQQGQNPQVMRKHFTNVCAVIKSRAGRGIKLTLPQDIQTVFPQLPVTVSISFVVDGQAVDTQSAEVPGTQEGTIYEYGRHAGSASASGRLCQISLKKSCGVHQYPQHQVVGYTAESGNASTTPKLILHLISPAAQQAEAAALRAEEQETGWFTHKYRNARCNPRSQSSSNRAVCLSQDLLDRAYPGVNHKGMNLQVTVIKNNMTVHDVGSNGKLTYYTNQRGGMKPMLVVSASAADALAGCCVQHLKAKSPNLFQVSAVSASSSQQLQQTVCNTTFTTHQPPTPPAAAPSLATTARVQAQAPPTPLKAAPPAVLRTQAQAASAAAAAQARASAAPASPEALQAALAPPPGAAPAAAQAAATPPATTAAATPTALAAAAAAPAEMAAGLAPLAPPPAPATPPAHVQAAQAPPPPVAVAPAPASAPPGASQAQRQKASAAAIMPIIMEAPVIVIDSDNDDDGKQQQPMPDFALTDCCDDIRIAGRQLTKLLRHLQAPDEQMVQLNGCINALRGHQADQARLRDFWYDYDQLQYWVERRNAAQCRGALQQLLCNANRNASS